MPQSKPAKSQRARQPAQIEQRRELILRAALEVYEKKGRENVRLLDIAEAAGVAKSNLYLYFESREHIYLQLLQREGDAWEGRVRNELERLNGSGTIAEISTIIAQSFHQSSRYCALMGVLTSVMRKKLSPAMTTNFRMVFHERRQRFAQAVAASLPGAPIEKIAVVPLSLFAYVSGIWPICGPPLNGGTAAETPELRLLELDFQTEMTRHTEIVLNGALM
jgi:AcrR family transcriptional regulator